MWRFRDWVRVSVGLKKQAYNQFVYEFAHRAAAATMIIPLPTIFLVSDTAQYPDGDHTQLLPGRAFCLRALATTIPLSSGPTSSI